MGILNLLAASSTAPCSSVTAKNTKNGPHSRLGSERAEERTMRGEKSRFISEQQWRQPSQ